MMLVKVKGGLICRGITESMTTAFTAGTIAMQNVCHQIEHFCGVSFTPSNEHVDARKTRIERDTSDFEKLQTWFEKNDPFCENDSLFAFNSKIVGTSEINCHKASQVGLEMLSKGLGSTFHSLPLKPKDTICSLADINSSLIVDKKRIAIDPLLLFQRMCISLTNNESLEEHLSFEMTPFPLSLFTEEAMWKGTKSSLYASFSTLEPPKIFRFLSTFTSPMVAFFYIKSFGKDVILYIKFLTGFWNMSPIILRIVFT